MLSFDLEFRVRTFTSISQALELRSMKSISSRHSLVYIPPEFFPSAVPDAEAWNNLNFDSKKEHWQEQPAISPYNSSKKKF